VTGGFALLMVTERLDRCAGSVDGLRRLRSPCRLCQLVPEPSLVALRLLAVPADEGGGAE